MHSKNFDFVKSIDDEKYSILCDIEHDSYLKPLIAAQACRRLYEDILRDLLDEKGIKSSSDAAEMYDLVRLHNLRLPSKRNLPRKNVKCYLKDQTISVETMDAYDFLKNLGNASSHNEPYPRYDKLYNPVPNRENVFYALELLHIIIRKVYKARIIEDVKKFEEKDIPIGDYFIDSELPGVADAARTNCIKEYVVHKDVSDNVDNKIYGLIREYDVSEINESNKGAFDRMHDVYGVLGNQMRREGVSYNPLNKLKDKYTNYFVIFEYDTDMIPLRSLLREKTLSIQDKLVLCLGIAKELNRFHSADEPVYIRLLTYDNIMVRLNSADSVEKYEPIIIKYEFSKIKFKDEDKAGLTILSLVQSVSNNDDIGLNSRLSRYCINEEFDEGTDWEKVDVGSLGVLFADICYGEITRTNPYELIDELKNNHSVPDCMTDLLMNMTDIVNICRPTLKEVIERMTEIIANI